jgi:hypothetical protein
MAEIREPLSRPADDPPAAERTVLVPTGVDMLGRPILEIETTADAADHWDIRRWRSDPRPASAPTIRLWRMHP